jgi:hypothetical protein
MCYGRLLWRCLIRRFGKLIINALHVCIAS